MTTRDDILERLSLAASYPWGPIRSSLTAEAVVWADALGTCLEVIEDCFDDLAEALGIDDADGADGGDDGTHDEDDDDGDE